MKFKKTLVSLLVSGTIILDLSGKAANANTIAWHYEDDFSTTKAKTDSYNHSTFWPKEAIPPPGGYLYYTSVSARAGMLALRGYYVTEEDAFLAYVFPLENVLTRIDSGTFEVDVTLSSYSEPIPPYYVPPYLVYQLSEDGANWTQTSPLAQGHNAISLLPSNNSHTYIRLSANSAKIDNLLVSVTGQEIPEPATLALLALGVGILARRNNKSNRTLKK